MQTSTETPLTDITPTAPSGGPYTVDNYRLDDSVGYLLRQAMNRLTAMVDGEMAPHDITSAQWATLLHLAEGKGDTAGDLCRCIGVDTGAMTRMLDRLEAKGLIRRVRCCNDRRVVRLSVTDEGRKLCDLLPAVAVKVLNRHLRGFSQQELAQFKNFLRRVIANADA